MYKFTRTHDPRMFLVYLGHGIFYSDLSIETNTPGWNVCESSIFIFNIVFGLKWNSGGGRRLRPVTRFPNERETFLSAFLLYLLGLCFNVKVENKVKWILVCYTSHVLWISYYNIISSRKQRLLVYSREWNRDAWKGRDAYAEILLSDFRLCGSVL